MTTTLPIDTAPDAEGRRLLDALEAASLLLEQTLPSRDVVQRLLEVTAKLYPADAHALWTHNAREHLWTVAASRGLSPQYADLSLREQVRSLGTDPVAIVDVDLNELVGDRRAMYETEGIRSLFIIPLHAYGEGSATLVSYYRTRHTFTEEDVTVARILARLASAALRSHKLDRLTEVGRVVSAELDLERLVQAVTDAATELTGAQFGAFFYNVLNERGESYTLYTISGVPREAFSKFPMPRNTPIFAPTFQGTGTVVSANIRRDPRYGKMPPHHGMPEGHLPVVSYLAVPVMSRTGEVLGGLFFGHADEGIFTESEVRIAEGLAAQASIGIDNARLYETLQRDRAVFARNERRYRSLVLATPTAQTIAIAALDGSITEDIPAWRAITGQTFEELRDHGWLNAVHAGDREAVREAWQAALAGRTLFEQHFRVRQTDGTYRWFAGKGVPVVADDGTMTEWIITATDIHDHKTSEDHLKFLAKAHELFSASLDYETTLKTLARVAVPDLADWCAVDIADETELYRRLAVAHVSPERIELARELRERYPPNAATDRVVNVLKTGQSELIPVVTDEMIVAGARDPEHLRVLRELNIRSFMVVPLRSRGQTLGAVTFVSSTWRRFTPTDLAHAEEFAHRASVAIDNARLYGRAQEANRAKDEFLATLSHELRTPMTAVLGWARMLRMGVDPGEYQTAIEAIEQSAQAQAQIIDDILDVSRIISGKLRIDPKPVDLRQIAESALTTVSHAAKAKGVAIEMSMAADVPAIAGDSHRLQQVIWNLLANAIKFTPRGGAVRLEVLRVGSLVRVVVRDTGRGIARDFLPHVFEAFRQEDSSTTREFGGLGLGLAIVKYLVELHGGRIAVASDGERRGASFIVDLPVLERGPNGDEQSVEELLASAVPNSDLLPSLKGLTVLVIDDQVFTRDLLCSILRRCQAQVMVAASVVEALELLQQTTPDVVVCDIAMPEHDGFTFLSELRLLPAPVSARPVIALTAFGRPEDRDRIMDAGFDAYLKKPVEPVELATTVARIAKR
ncbi:MAG TPA: GAF domain-containing protein [Thermoanaerobaculia bacterium]|jgi:PAS domain S-box-containing protein